MAVFLLRAKHGAGYQPPAATGTMFTDVPVTHPFATWIEQLAREGITGGCGTMVYCPDASVDTGADGSVPGPRLQPANVSAPPSSDERGDPARAAFLLYETRLKSQHA